VGGVAACSACGIDRAATAIRHGASGFLLKDTTPLMLRDAIPTVHVQIVVFAHEHGLV
jgi:DNA-binding NarL/FixJ family response regulator